MVLARDAERDPFIIIIPNYGTRIYPDNTR